MEYGGYTIKQHKFVFVAYLDIHTPGCLMNCGFRTIADTKAVIDWRNSVTERALWDGPGALVPMPVVDCFDLKTGKQLDCANVHALVLRSAVSEAAVALPFYPDTDEGMIHWLPCWPVKEGKIKGMNRVLSALNIECNDSSMLSKQPYICEQGFMRGVIYPLLLSTDFKGGRAVTHDLSKALKLKFDPSFAATLRACIPNGWDGYKAERDGENIHPKKQKNPFRGVRHKRGKAKIKVTP